MTCPHCGYEADPDQGECPLCGTPLEGTGREREPAASSAAPSRPEAGSAAGRGDAGEEGGDAAAGRTPWEAGGGIGALFSSWWESLSDPDRFFSRVDWDGGLEAPLLYFLCFAVVGAAFSAFWSAAMGSVMGPVAAAERLGFPAGSALLQFFLAPFMALFSLAIWAALAHAAVRLLTSNPRPIRATLRSLCYTSGPQVLLIVPFVGSLAAMVWSAVLAVVGIRRAHRTSTGRAVGALLLGFGMLVFGWIAIAVVLFAFLGGNLPVPLPGGG